MGDINYLKKAQAVAGVDWRSGVFIPVDKPLDWTSFDVVNKLRYQLKRITGVKKFKVGHAGTLDPRATGLLIIACGKATKSIQAVTDDEKSYSGKIKIGATTASYDTEQEEDQQFPTDHISDEMIDDARIHFTGVQGQLPPMFSAIRKDGQRLYQLARQGKEIEREARQVDIKALELRRVDKDFLHFDCRCSKGTYIRSLAHDIGQFLKSGAYLIELKRTYIGDFSLKDAWQLDDLVAELSQINHEPCQ